MTGFIFYTIPRCKYFGCAKQLNPTEYLFGEYCFKHSQFKNQKKVIMYTAKLYRYNYNSNNWELQRTYNLDIDTYIRLGECLDGTHSPYYMYQLYNNTQLTKTFYSHSPNIIDIV